MIWATVTSRSCFRWLYRAAPSLAAKNTINLILVLTIWWCPCVESSLVLLEEGVCYDQCVLLANISLCPASFCTPGQICLLLQVFLDFLLLHSSPLYWGFPGGSDSKASACNAGDPGSIPGSGRSPGEGNGNSLQYSCLENPITREDWGLQSMRSQRVGHYWGTKLKQTSLLELP